MIDINPKTYAENYVHTITVIQKDNKSVLWMKIHNIKDKLGIKNMSDLTIKAIKGIYDTEASNTKDVEKSLAVTQQEYKFIKNLLYQ